MQPCDSHDFAAQFSLSQKANAQSDPSADLLNQPNTGGALKNDSQYRDSSLPREARNIFRDTRDPEVQEISEFQHFVNATTGVMLSNYGSALFASQAASFASFEHAAAPEDFIVSTDDELRIHIWGQINFSANLHVSREGEIYLPKIGQVHVSGLTFASVKDQIREAIGRVYKNFECSVNLGEIHTIRIYVTGQARRPGQYTIGGLGTLVEAIFLSAGPSASGSMRHVQLKRAGKLISDFDLYALLIKGDKSGDVQLKSGDVLYFQLIGSQVALLGSVQTPAIYELRDDESIASLLEMAGGRTATASDARASLERIDSAGSRHAFTLTLNAEGLSTHLKNADILRIESIVSNFTQSVTLRGSVATPGHYRWHSGMHMSELMPEREALETREYWWHRTELGLPAPEFVETPATTTSGTQTPSDFRKHAQTSSIASSNSERMEEHTLILQTRSQTNWNYAVIERLDLKTMRTFLIPFDPGRLVLNHDSSQDFELEQGDVVTIFSQDDLNLPSMQQTKYVRLEGEFAHAGIYSVTPGETLRSLAQRAGGLTPNAYLYGSEFTRKSTRILEQQRLDEYTARIEQEMHHNTLAAAGQMTMGGANNNATETASLNRDALDRMRQLKASGRIVLNMRPQSTGIDALPELPLEDGDRLIVPAQPATVQVVGAVMNQNAFLYRPDAHLSEYLRDAGGPSRQADKSRTFILRADGSVTSSISGQSIFTSSAIGSQKLNPGDTIVVPEKLWRPSAMNELMAWVQLFSSFSLSAAAISTFK